jgi:hypothetical protein
VYIGTPEGSSTQRAFIGTARGGLGWRPAARYLRLCRFGFIVIRDMRLGRFARVVVCELSMALREMRVVCSRFCVSSFVLFRGVFVVPCCVFVVLCGLHVMLCGLLGHKSPFPALPSVPTKTLRDAVRTR